MYVSWTGQVQGSRPRPHPNCLSSLLDAALRPSTRITQPTLCFFLPPSLHQSKHKSQRIRAYGTRSLRRNYVDCFCELAVISWLGARSAQPASAMSPFLFPHPSPMVSVGKASPPEDRVSRIRIPLPPSLDPWEIFPDLTSRTTSNKPRQCAGEGSPCPSMLVPSLGTLVSLSSTLTSKYLVRAFCLRDPQTAKCPAPSQPWFPLNHGEICAPLAFHSPGSACPSRFGYPGLGLLAITPCPSVWSILYVLLCRWLAGLIMALPFQKSEFS
ncbi:hypothetical protein BGZ61DRAFT_129700 [Ilyonectria robusta]|uniref:uncharacterized protein n=1 Tax=Ilyonectria robusta TaxID=1079257 RepID=UPI001E8E2AF1|nr:uncharacterized protein BGZ61DRAFT_129700 [Ilyonectria robusta]KAH8734784.1 hypothetical protein BGZ61DRAFT_129700 [Ilyonectria robusta]